MSEQADYIEPSNQPTEAALLSEELSAAWDTVKAALLALVRAVQLDIGDEYRAYPEDEEPSIQLTVAHNLKRCATDPEFVRDGWTYQTGDNSYTGGAYSRPDWAVVGVYRNSDPADVIDDILSQFSELEG